MQIVGTKGTLGQGQGTLEKWFRLSVPALHAENVGQVSERSHSQPLHLDVTGQAFDDAYRPPEDRLSLGVAPEILLNGSVRVQYIRYVGVLRSGFPFQEAQGARAQRPRLLEPPFGVAP